jgi:hypothetical protein
LAQLQPRPLLCSTTTVVAQIGVPSWFNGLITILYGGDRGFTPVSVAT